LRTKKQGKHLTLKEHDDDEERIKFYGRFVESIFNTSFKEDRQYDVTVRCLRKTTVTVENQ